VPLAGEERHDRECDHRRGGEDEAHAESVRGEGGSAKGER
jgi:hypothetical protein